MAKKKKKEKIVYYDDGSSVADLSGLKKKPLVRDEDIRPQAGFKAQAQTFFGAMKMMVVPMITVICALGVIYMILYFLFFLFG